MLGGLLAVVWTESVQTILLLVGAVVITVVGYLKIGGWTELVHTLASNPHPLASVPTAKLSGAREISEHGARLKRPKRFGVVFDIARLSGIGESGIGACDQTIVQRVLAARDEKNARLGRSSARS